MSLRIAVFDPLPLVRHGAIAALHAAGLDSESPPDLLTWLDEDRRLAVLSLLTKQDWQQLKLLTRSYANVLVLALLPDDWTSTHVRALRAGAAGTAPRHSTPEQITEAVTHILEGRSLLPLAVLQELARSEGNDSDDDFAPDPRDLEWLVMLSEGVTVADLAQRAGYSERMMFRLLRDLYTRFHASNRAEAHLIARERGWL